MSQTHCVVAALALFAQLQREREKALNLTWSYRWGRLCVMETCKIIRIQVKMLTKICKDLVIFSEHNNVISIVYNQTALALNSLSAFKILRQQ